MPTAVPTPSNPTSTAAHDIDPSNKGSPVFSGHQHNSRCLDPMLTGGTFANEPFTNSTITTPHSVNAPYRSFQENHLHQQGCYTASDSQTGMSAAPSFPVDNSEHITSSTSTDYLDYLYPMPPLLTSSHTGPDRQLVDNYSGQQPFEMSLDYSDTYKGSAITTLDEDAGFFQSTDI
jgi:hypothetical protein